MKHSDKNLMEKNRLEALIDGIFAIVMTLLIMPVVVPQRESLIKDTDFFQMLRMRVHDIFNYALSFTLLAIFWAKQHEQSQFVKKTDWIHICINLTTLFFIALFPFSTSLITEFPDQDLSELVFGSNMIIVGTLFLVNWLYVSKNKRLIDSNLSDWDIAAVRNKCFFFLVSAIALIIVCQRIPGVTADVFWMIPPLLLSEYLFKKSS